MEKPLKGATVCRSFQGLMTYVTRSSAKISLRDAHSIRSALPTEGRGARARFSSRGNSG